MYADPEVVRHLGDGKTMDAMQSWRACAALLGHWPLRGYGQWVVEEKASGAAMGRSGLYHPEGWPGLEVGWTLAREHWGKGYATEAGAASLRYAFEQVGSSRVISLIRPDNPASIRVAEKLGGVYETTISMMGGVALVYAYTSRTLER
jgi:RimJ/RimL family protein N-acetyltransferase